MGNGSYVYFGVKSALLEGLESNTIPSSSTLFLTVNVDGIPLFRSSSKQFWPILVKVQEGSRPFVAALYVGDSKPESVTDFMKDFVEELYFLQNKGITHA